jgi:hypothetical protein
LSLLARGGWVQAQRHAPYADLDFTDEEVVTIDLFAVALEQKRQIQGIRRHAGRYGSSRPCLRALGRRYICAQCLATKRLIRIEGAIFITPVNDRFTFNQHRERLN